MISNFEKHLNIRLLESQLKMSANNRIPLNLVDCFKPSELCIFEQQLKKTNQVDVDIINTEIQGNNTPTTLGAYIGLFGNSSDTRCFLICEGEDCDFLVDDEDPMYEQYFYLFKLVNEKDVDSFANKVK